MITYSLVFLLGIFSLVRPTDRFLLPWEEVLCDGFGRAAFFPSDRREARHVLIVAIKDNKMGSIST